MSVSTRDRILDYVRTYIKQNGYAPTVREISQAVYLSSYSVVVYHLRNLQRDKLLKIARNTARGITLTDPYTPASAWKITIIVDGDAARQFTKDLVSAAGQLAKEHGVSLLSGETTTGAKCD